MLEPPMDYTQNYIQYPANIIVICVNSTEEIAKGIKKLLNSAYWSAHTKHIIHVKHETNFHMIFYLFWLYKVLNCIIIKDYNDEIYVYDFDPYVSIMDDSFDNQYGCWSLKNMSNHDDNMLPFIKCKNGCKDLNFDRYSKTEFYSTCIEIRYRNCNNKNLNYFQDKTINMNGYKMKLMGVPMLKSFIVETNSNGKIKLKGKYGYFIDTIFEKMNLSFALKIKINISIAEWFNGFYELEEGKIDMMGTPFYVKPYTRPKIDLTHFIEDSGICFLVRKPDIIPTWKTFRNIFDKNGLILTAIVFHVTVFIYLIFLKPKISNFHEKLIYSYLCAVQFFVSQPVDWVSKKKYIRVYVLIVYWFVFVVNFILQGTIAALLTIPKTEKNIDTFMDLYESGYMIEGFEEIQIFFPSTSPAYVTLNKRLVKINKIYGCIDDLKNGSKKACLFDCSMAYILMKTQKDKDGCPFIYIAQEKLNSHYLALTLNYNSPLTKRMNYYIRRIIESGLPLKWKKFYSFDKSASTELEKLNMTDNQFCFYVLLFGLGFSLIVFIIEHILNALIKKITIIKRKTRN